MQTVQKNGYSQLKKHNMFPKIYSLLSESDPTNHLDQFDILYYKAVNSQDPFLGARYFEAALDWLIETATAQFWIWHGQGALR